MQQSTIIFSLILVLIGLIFVYAFRDKLFKKGQGGKVEEPLAQLKSCSLLPTAEVLALQKKLNSKGCKDYNGNTLVEDGVCGPLTTSAYQTCNI